MPSKSRGPFVGREHLLNQLDELLARPGLISLIGPGGVGKTRLVGEFFARNERLTPYYVWLDEVADSEHVAARVAVALGLGSLGERDLDRALDHLASQSSAVLVLDNAEHVPDGVRGVVEALPSSVRCIVTTTVDLGLGVGLPVPELPAAEARELLQLRARMQYVDLSPQECDQLSEALDRLPLAIELAAARTVIMTPEQILERLARSNRVLGSSGTARQDTLDATIRWSWELLDDGERSIASALCMFDHPVVPGLLEAMWPRLDVPTIAMSLEQKSWMRVVEGPDGKRWSTLWAMRRFVQGQTGESERTEHDRRLVAWAEQHVDQTPGWWASFVPEALAVVELQRGARDYGTASKILRRTFYGAFGGPHFLPALDAATRLLEEWEPDLAPEQWSMLATDLAKGAAHSDWSHRRRHWSARALEVAPPGTDSELRAGACHVVSLVMGGEHAEAESLLSELDARLEALADEVANAGPLLDFATAAHELGRLELARRLSQQVWDIGLREKAANVQSRALVSLAYVSYDLGEFDRAEEQMRRLSSLLERSHSRERALLGGVLPPLLALRHGDFEEAQDELQKRGEVAKETGDRALAFYVQVAWAEWAFFAKPGATFGHLERAAGIAAQDETSKSLTHTRFLQLIDELVRGDYAAARPRLDALRAAKSPANPSHWSSLLNAFEWLLGALSGGDPGEPPESSYGRLCHGLYDSLKSLDLEPLQRVLQSTPAADWAVPGLYFVRLDNIASRWLELAIGVESTPFLKIERSGRRFVLPESEVQDISRRGPLRRILLRLAQERNANVGMALTAEDIIEAGWPDEQILHEAALTRVYTTMNRLRSLGFDEWLETLDNGYMLKPQLEIEWTDDL